MIDITWFITALSLTGVILNIKRKRAGFLVWMVTNSAWAVYDYQIGAYAQSALFAVYLGLAVWGWMEWGKC